MSQNNLDRSRLQRYPSLTEHQRKQIEEEQQAVEQQLAALGLKLHEAGGQKNCQIYSVIDALQTVRQGRGGNIQAQLQRHRKEVKTWLTDNYGLLRGKSTFDSTDYIQMYCDDAINITPASWKEKWSHFVASSGTYIMMGDELSLIALAHILSCRIKIITKTGTITLPHFGTPSDEIHLAM